MTNGTESAEAPRRSRRAADVPVDTPAGPRERESQQRARDREALRAYKALTDTPERRDPETAPPTRRQLRMQQQQRAAAGHAVPASVSVPVPSADEAATDTRTAPVAPDAGATPSAPPSAATDNVPLRRDRRGRQPATDSPSVQERDTEADVSGTEPTPRADEKGSASPDASTRRRTRRAAPAPETAGSTPDSNPNADVAGMSVEQALAARKALEGQARNQVAAMELLQSEDPHAVDLELLAQQKALAERAKVLNRRTRAIQKMSEENEQRRPSSSDPTTAHNLAMVTPLEFIEVPGVEHPVMKAPPTSHVPVVTSTTPRVEAAARPLPVVPAQRPASAPRRVPAGATDVRHSRILARADALVNAPAEAAASPIGARSAFGLEPLDVMTAGLGRTRRLRFAAAGVAGLGTLALIVGILMIVGGLGG